MFGLSFMGKMWLWDNVSFLGWSFCEGNCVVCFMFLVLLLGKIMFCPLVCAVWHGLVSVCFCCLSTDFLLFGIFVGFVCFLGGGNVCYGSLWFPYKKNGCFLFVSGDFWC